MVVRIIEAEYLVGGMNLCPQMEEEDMPTKDDAACRGGRRVQMLRGKVVFLLIPQDFLCSFFKLRVKFLKLIALIPLKIQADAASGDPEKTGRFKDPLFARPLDELFTAVLESLHETALNTAERLEGLN